MPTPISSLAAPSDPKDKVLAHLGRHHDLAYTLDEVMTIALSGRGHTTIDMTRAMLHELVAAGLVRKIQQGVDTYYAAVPAQR